MKEKKNIRVGMSGSSAGLPLRQGKQEAHVKSEFDMDSQFNVDGFMEGTPEDDVDDAISNGEESDETKKLRKKREVCSVHQSLQHHNAHSMFLV